jgi:hypothetical protein
MPKFQSAILITILLLLSCTAEARNTRRFRFPARLRTACYQDYVHRSYKGFKGEPGIVSWIIHSCIGQGVDECGVTWNGSLTGYFDGVVVGIEKGASWRRVAPRIRKLINIADQSVKEQTIR